MSKRTWMMALVAAGMLAGAAGTATAGEMRRGIVADFSQNKAGWSGPTGLGGRTFVDPSLGGPNGNALHTQFEDFGITFSNTQARWLEAFHHAGAVEVGLQANTFSIFFFSTEVPRTLVLEIRSRADAVDGYPWSSVWVPLGTLQSSVPGWQTFKVRIPDTQSATLPEGWGGYGAEDPVTYEPTLPAGKTFADILAHADEIAFTTYQPGYFYGMADFDVAVDNLFVKHLRSAD